MTLRSFGEWSRNWSPVPFTTLVASGRAGQWRWLAPTSAWDGNLAWAFSCDIAALPLAPFGLLNPLIS